MSSASVEDSFERARTHAAHAGLVVVRLNGECLILPVAKTSIKAEALAAIERMIPSATKRYIAVIGEISWTTNTPPSLQAAAQAIPFFGLIAGMTSIGHAVWVFNAASNLIAAGCKGADLLIVDSASIAMLPGDWQAEAEKVMRTPQILIHDRASYRLRPPGTQKLGAPPQS